MEKVHTLFSVAYKFMFISKVHEKLEENLKDQAALAACRIQKNLAQRFT
jgi:hypothetical protein